MSLASHDGDLSDVPVAAGPIGLSATIDNYATANLRELSGAGSFSQTGTQTGPLTGIDTYTLDFGTIALGATAPTADLEALNAASGLADLMSGTFQLGSTTGFNNTGFGAFTGLGAGQADAAQPTISLSTGQAGAFSETVTLTATGTNASGYDGATPSDTLTITGTVEAPPPPDDFTGNGISDVLFTDTNGGDVAYWTVQDGVKTGAVPQFPNKPLNEVEHGRSGGIRGQFGSGYRVDRLPRLFVRTDDESRRGVVQPSRVMRWARWHGEALRS